MHDTIVPQALLGVKHWLVWL